MNTKLVLLLFCSVYFANNLLASEREKAVEKSVTLKSTLNNKTLVKNGASKDKIPSKMPAEKKIPLKKNDISNEIFEKNNLIMNVILQKEIAPSIKSDLNNSLKTKSNGKSDFLPKSTALKNPFNKSTLRKNSTVQSSLIPSKDVLIRQETLGAKFASPQESGMMNPGRNGIPPITSSRVSQF